MILYFLARFGRSILLPLVLASIAPTASLAQSAGLRLGVVYQCPGSASFKVYSCSGPQGSDTCDAESAVPGKPHVRGKSTRDQIMQLVAVCQPQVGGDPQGASSSAGVAANGRPDANGFKVGDEVNAATAGGWAVMKIVRSNGDSYLVRLGSTEVWKAYPTELRRLGLITDVDRAHGVFALHDKVQVNVDGTWVPGEIATELGMEYQVNLAGNRTAWATGQNLRLVPGSAKVAAAKSATSDRAPPRPGMKRCAGKIEGRYASTGGVGGFQITFRSGKALLPGVTGDDEYECWMEGEKIVLHKAGQSSDMDMPIDVNSDGSLQTPMGDIHKKGN